MSSYSVDDTSSAGAPKLFGIGGKGGGDDDENGCARPPPPSLPLSEAWKIEPDCECCERAYWCSRPRALRAGVDGRNCGGLAPVCARDGTGGACACADTERLNGFRSAGYACGSSTGTGGGASACFVLLNAFRREAKEDFFVKGELLLVATEDCAEWVKDALGGLRDVVWTDWPESWEAIESPRAWKYDPPVRSAKG